MNIGRLLELIVKQGLNRKKRKRVNIVKKGYLEVNAPWLFLCVTTTHSCALRTFERASSHHATQLLPHPPQLSTPHSLAFSCGPMSSPPRCFIPFAIPLPSTPSLRMCLLSFAGVFTVLVVCLFISLLSLLVLFVHISMRLPIYSYNIHITHTRACILKNYSSVFTTKENSLRGSWCFKAGFTR